VFHIGDTIDQYRLTRILGEGAYGKVFASENTVSGLVCALKVVPLGGKAGDRELRALQQYQNISHPNLIRIHHAGITGEYLYYTMDLADGTIAEQRLSPAGLLVAAVKLADALAQLHADGLLHRDIKPDNLLWRQNEPILGDISLVTAREGASLSGTPGFLAPAIRDRGEAPTQWSDLYALAKSFYCLLSGNPPGAYPDYQGTLDPQASILLRAILSVCDGKKNISSAAEFRDALKVDPAEAGRRFGGRSKRWIFCLCGAFLLILTVLFFFGTRREKKNVPFPEPPSSSETAGTCTPPSGEPAQPLPVAEPKAPVEPVKKPSPPSRHPLAENILRELHAAEVRSAEEKRAIAEQRKVYEGLRKKAEEMAEKKHPRRSPTSMNAILAGEEYRLDTLESLVDQRSKADPMFRCFYVMAEELEQLSHPLYALEDHPDHAEYMRNEYQAWKKQLELYQKERDVLLSSGK